MNGDDETLDAAPEMHDIDVEKKKRLAHLTGTMDFGFLPIPKRLRYNPARPARFGLLLNIIFGLASTFIVANLYYCQPILIPLSQSFDVSYEEISRVPTLMQAGYGAGLILVTPLGDLVRRRPLLLITVLVSTSLTIGLAVTNSLAVFETLCFLTGMSSVAPQILIPLAADLAPPQRRASAISIVLSGLLFGVLIARVVAGVIADFASYRVVYYTSIGVQCGVLVALWVVLPDYPAKNPDLTYLRILWSMMKLAVTEPILIQACLISIGSSACFTCFWVTLTFLLGSNPYNFSTLVIGLFGLVGMFGVAMAPLTGRLVDRLVPWYATVFATLWLVCIQSIYTGAAGLSVGVVVIVTVGLDVGRQMQQVSLTTAVYGISEKKRARLNAVLILSIFLGQVMGTAVGSKVFLAHGWHASGALMLGLTGSQLFFLLMRGPHAHRKTWFGYQGGIEWRKTVVMERTKRAMEEVEAKAKEENGRDKVEGEKGTGEDEGRGSSEKDRGNAGPVDESATKV